MNNLETFLVTISVICLVTGGVMIASGNMWGFVAILGSGPNLFFSISYLTKKERSS